VQFSRQTLLSFWDLHAWTGLIAGLILYAMFFAGSVGVFHHEFGLWEEPVAQAMAAQPPVDPDSMLAAFDKELGLPEKFRLYLPEGHFAAPKVCYKDAPSGSMQCRLLDSGGNVVPERGVAAHILVSLHFLWHESAPWLYKYVAPLLGITMLLAIFSGLLIHLRHLKAQFYRFRPRQKLRAFWSDLHKVLGVIGLPFQAYMAFSGLLIITLPVMVGAFAKPLFQGDEKAASASGYVWGSFKAPPPREELTPITNLGLNALIAKAQSRHPEFQPREILYSHYGTADPLVEIRGEMPDPFLAFSRIWLRVRDGEILHASTPQDDAPLEKVQRVLFGLHYLAFGSTPLKLVYVFLGLFGSMTILSGNWIWLARRERNRKSFGNRLLARLTDGVGAGLPFATAVVFAATQVVTLTPESRHGGMELIFFGSWLLGIGYGLLEPSSRLVWVRLLALTAVGFTSLPVLAAFQGGQGLFATTAARIPTVVGVEVAFLATGLAFFAAAVLIRSSKAANTEKDQSNDPVPHQLVEVSGD
jgi:uncharacterized iron-regulated membrane protein